jgi:hypothetical protein
VLAFLAAAPASGVLLSRAYAENERGTPWPYVGPGYLPWLLASACFVAGVGLGTLSLIVPGILIGVRLFWADEFALVHGYGPVSAIRESLDLTRGRAGQIFGFQFTLGFAEYLVLIPLFLGFAAAE